MNARALLWIRLAWVAGTLILVATWRGEAFVLFVPLALLGPVLREFVAVGEDERQRFEDYHASHVALMTVFALLFLFAAKAQVVDGTGIPGELILLFAVPLIVRGGLSIGRGFGARRAGLAIGFITGALWLGFTLASHGLSSDAVVEASIGGSLLVATAAATRWPRAGGATLVVLGVALLALVVPPQIGRGAWTMAFAMTAALAAPTIVAGGLLVASSAGKGGTRGDEFADLRKEVRR
jgi:hypothetical protein